MKCLGEKNIKRIVITALVADIFFILLFGVVVGSPLPRGIRIFKQISLLFY